MIGLTLDRKYKLVSLLGEGGMGSVYEARHTGTRRRVAVKLIRSDRLAPGSGAPSRFRREARAAGTVESRHIVQILDSGADEATGNLYLVMEYLVGEDLQHLLERAGRLPPDVALRIAAQTLLGLAKAHEAGIVHRDIKPANLFLARQDDGTFTVKVLDFGIAKIRGDPLHGPQTTGLTETGGFLGSPLYMSPEQVRSSKDVDGRTDVWSLGCVLYAALVGSPPHQEVTSIGGLILAICGAPAPPIRERVPEVPEEVASVVHGALAIEPAERTPSAEAMLEAIRKILPDGFVLPGEVFLGIAPHPQKSLGVAPEDRAEAGAETVTSDGDLSTDDLGLAATSTASQRPAPPDARAAPPSARHAEHETAPPAAARTAARRRVVAAGAAVLLGLGGAMGYMRLQALESVAVASSSAAVVPTSAPAPESAPEAGVREVVPHEEPVSLRTPEDGGEPPRRDPAPRPTASVKPSAPKPVPSAKPGPSTAKPAPPKPVDPNIPETPP